MELENHTPFPAGLFRTILDETRFAASVLTRVTYRIEKGRLSPADEQPWIVSFPPWESEYGPMDSDEVFYKGGIDFFLFGHACAPGGRPVPELRVTLEAGREFRRSVNVIGDRVWKKKWRKLVPSEPQPFLRLPLTLDNAFGGKQEWDGLETFYVQNPAGKGYYLDEERAADHPLPNIEEPDQPVRTWEDRPMPAGLGLCSQQNPLRAQNGLKTEEDGNVEIFPTFFNAAFPRMIMKTALSPGERVQVTGASPDGPIEFEIPDARFVVRLRFGDELIERPLAIDQVGVEGDRQRVFIAYRYPFRYKLYPMQRRSCELLLSGREAGGPHA